MQQVKVRFRSRLLCRRRKNANNVREKAYMIFTIDVGEFVFKIKSLRGGGGRFMEMILVGWAGYLKQRGSMVVSGKNRHFIIFILNLGIITGRNFKFLGEMR